MNENINKIHHIREKKIYCGSNFLEVDIIPRSGRQKIKPGQRSKKEKVSAPKQKNLNSKNARRYFIQLLNSNFGEEDLHVTVTYKDKYLPETIEDANREAVNFIRRISYWRKKAGLDPLKYILVTECSTSRSEGKPIRIHHHIIMNSGLSREAVENLWRKPRKKGEKEGDKIGYANTDRLQPNEYGLEALARYLTKNPKGKKRWSGSQNLNKPWSRNNDFKYSKRKVEKIIKVEADNNEYWQKQYPGWILTEYTPKFNDITGWSIYLKLRKLKE